MANKCQMCQMASDIDILCHNCQEWLEYQTFTALKVKFHVLTGNDLCHSQANGIFFHYF